jgi:hypothetical protein
MRRVRLSVFQDLPLFVPTHLCSECPALRNLQMKGGIIVFILIIMRRDREMTDIEFN